MKRLFVYLIIASALLFLCGCGDNNIAEGTTEYSVFCLDRDENALKSISYSTQSEDRDELTKELINKLSEPSIDVALREAVRGFDITDYSITENLINVGVSEEYKNMEFTTEILVRAAIVRTLTQVPGIEYVSMHIGDEELQDALGQPVAPMTSAQFIENAGNEINAYEKAKLKLYFASEDGKSLIATNRTVVYNTNISMEKLVVEQLIMGPQIEGMYPAINPQTSIINVTIKDGICYVNLSDAFLSSPNNVQAEIAVYSIVNSLAELPGVNKVQINIDGKTDIQIKDNLSLSTVFERNLEVVRK